MRTFVGLREQGSGLKGYVPRQVYALPSSSGLGRCLLTANTGVRVPWGTLIFSAQNRADQCVDRCFHLEQFGCIRGQPVFAGGDQQDLVVICERQAMGYQCIPIFKFCCIYIDVWRDQIFVMPH